MAHTATAEHPKRPIRFSRPLENLYHFLCANCSAPVAPGDTFYYVQAGHDALEGEKVCENCMEDLQND